MYRIDVLTEIKVQVEKFLKNNKRAGQNRRAGGKIFSKSINVQTKIRPCRGEFFLKINKRACTSIRYTRVFDHFDPSGNLTHLWHCGGAFALLTD